MTALIAVLRGFIGRGSANEPGMTLASQAVGNLGLNVASLLLHFATALLLSRLLGPAGYGAYAFAVAWAMLLAVPALLGLPQLVVREIATYRVREDWGRIHGLLRRASQASFAVSLVVALTAALVFWALDWPGPPLLQPTLVGLFLVPLMIVITMRQCAMQGFDALVLGRTPETLVAPVLMIALIVVAHRVFADGVSATSAVGAQVLASALAALLGIYLFRRILLADVLRAEPRYETRAWMTGALPMFLTAGISAVNAQAGIILTGAIAGSQEAGIYNVAFRVAGFLPFLFIAALPAMMPTIAGLYERGDSERLQLFISRTARAVFLATVPLAIGVFLFAESILGLFGDDFAAGITPLRIMCLGQLVNVATGYANTALVMTGNAGAVTKAVAISAGVNLLLCSVLIPMFGAAGAAVATATSVALANLTTTTILWRRRRIYSAAIGLPRVFSA